MRLKPAGIFFIVLIIAILAYFAIKPRVSKSGNENSTEATTTREVPEKDSSGNQNAPAATRADDAEGREFNYTPEKPIDGTLRGVVELGATGFNSFVINMDNQKRWEIVSKDFGESLAYEGLPTTEDIRAGLKRDISGMLDKGVAKKNTNFLIA